MAEDVKIDYRTIIKNSDLQKFESDIASSRLISAAMKNKHDINHFSYRVPSCSFEITTMNHSLGNTSYFLASDISVENCSLPLSHGLALISINTIVSIAGTLGNLLVCLAVAKVPRLRRPANFLLFSLALADLLVTMVCVPLFLVILTRRAFFNDCAKDLERPYVILSMLSCSASVEHIAAISVDRVIAILYPLHYKGIMENRGWKAMLLKSWISPIVVPVLNPIIPKRFPKRFVAFGIFSLSYMAVFVSYSLIVISLVKHRKKQIQIRAYPSNDAGNFQNFRVEIRIAFTLAIVIVVFTACWVPLFATFFAAGKLLVNDRGMAFIWIRTLALSNSAMNFVIYGSRMRNFREAFTEILRKILSCCECSRTNVPDVRLQTLRS